MDFELVLKSTILEALIEKITNVQNKATNTAAIEAFIKIVTDEPESARIAVRLINTKIQSPYEWEALQALHLLELCISTNPVFQTEVGKFRFLNDLIKLVSPKYLGNSTSSVIKNRIVTLLKAWSHKYSKEPKIKEAFDMLIKQGVIAEESSQLNGGDVTSNLSVCTNSISVSTNGRPSVFEEDEQKSRLLQKLLRSNKPDDLKAANHLIKTMVKEKEEKEDIRLISNNAKLLSEMLSNASPSTSTEDYELMKELKETCVNMKPTVAFWISCNKTAMDAAELFELNDLLNETLQLYNETMISVRKSYCANLEKPTEQIMSTSTTLVDFGSSFDEVPLKKSSHLLFNMKEKSETETLEEIFKCTHSPKKAPINTDKEEPHRNPHPTCSASTSEIYQDFDMLGASVSKLSANADKLDDIISSFNLDLTSETRAKLHQFNCNNLLNDDDELIVGNDAPKHSVCDTVTSHLSSPKCTTSLLEQVSVEPLSDVSVPLIEIKTDGKEKITAFEDPVGINVSVQLAKNKPRNDVFVFLVLSCSRKNEPISSFLFQPVVPKDCRLKLQTPSKCDLPPFNPHLPMETIIQIMLIASVKKDCIPLKFVISYVEKDETRTEMGEVASLSLR